MTMAAIAEQRVMAARTRFEPAFVAGGALAVLLFLAGACLHDKEPIGLAFGAVLGLALSRTRFARLGFALVGLLCANVAFFTVLETASNLVQPGGLSALAIPAALAVTAVVGLVLCFGMVVGRPFEEALLRSVVLGAALVLVLVLAFGLARSSATVTAASQGLTLRADGQKFSATQFETTSGELTVTMSNGDLFWHTFTIDELGVNAFVPVGGTRTITFNAPPGTYHFYCAIPGHAALGMRGTLVVR
jgi:plastocyanin